LEYNESVNQLFIEFMTIYDSFKRENLCNNHIEFVIPLKLIRATKTCLNEIYSRVRVGKHLSDTFPGKNGLKRDDLSPFFGFALEYTIRKV
jgi:hypothetical protein